MNTQTEPKLVVAISEVTVKTENPMQEQHFHEVLESIELTAEAVLTARRLEACAERGQSSKGEAGPIFVP